MSSQYCLPELYDTLPGLLCHAGSPPGLQGPLCGGLCQPPGLRLQRSPEPPPGPLRLHRERHLLPGQGWKWEAPGERRRERTAQPWRSSRRPCFPGLFPLQQGDSFVNDDCSQRCTCARTGVLLCEPLGCSPGEVCTLGNLTRGCFRGEPGRALSFQLPLSPVGAGEGGSPWTWNKPALSVLGRAHLIKIRTLLPFHFPLSLSLSGGTRKRPCLLSLCSLLCIRVSRSPLVLNQHLGW